MRRIVFIMALALCFLEAKPQKIDIQMSAYTFALNDSISFSVCNTDSLDVFYAEDVFNSAYGKSIVLCLKPSRHSRLSFKLRNQVLYYMRKHKIQSKMTNELNKKGAFRLKVYCGLNDKKMDSIIYSDTFIIR